MALATYAGPGATASRSASRPLLPAGALPKQAGTARFAAALAPSTVSEAAGPGTIGFANAPPNIVAPLLAATAAAAPAAPTTVIALPGTITTVLSAPTTFQPVPMTTPPAPVTTITMPPVPLTSPVPETLPPLGPSPGSAVGSRLMMASTAAAAAASAPVPVGEWHPPVGPPVSLTQGMPDPMMVQRQKEGFVRSLDDHLRQGAVALDSQHKQQRDIMHAAAEQQKVHFGQQIDQQVKMQEMDLDQQFLQVLQHVKQQATRQRAQLEQQAMQLSFEYQEKKVEEDMLAHQFELSKHQQALKNQMMMQGPVSPLPTYLPPTPGMPTQQVPSNPFAASQLSAISADALAPALSYAPPGAGVSTVGYVSSSYVPPQDAATAAFSGSASRMMAAAMPQPTVVGATTVAAAPTVLQTVAAAPTTVMSSSYSPAPVPRLISSSAPVTSVVSQPTTSFAPTLSPQPSVATMQTVQVAVM